MATALGEHSRPYRTSVLETAGTTLLRAADALHLSTAAEHGFHEIYSNDVKLLKAAAYFEIRGMDVVR